MGERGGERKIAYMWGIKIHETYLLIKIQSNVKTSSCFYFMAICQYDLTEQSETSGLKKKKRNHYVQFPKHNIESMEEGEGEEKK